MKTYCVFLLVLFIFFAPNVEAFTGTYGINYGRLADNIPSPDAVVRLLRKAKIKNVRIFDFDHSVLKAFSGTGLELVVGVPNGYLLKEMSSNPDRALAWVKDNVQAFLPETNIVGITVGNEVLGSPDQSQWEALVGAVKNIYNATKMLKLDDVVQIQTAHSQAVFNTTFPPSSGNFTESVAPYMMQLLELFSKIGSPFCLNAYPFLAYMSKASEMDINYALFEPNKGVDDKKAGLHYDNLLDAQIDAAYAALEDAGFKKMEVIVTETGWASRGDENEAAATVTNARTYNYNLRKRLAKHKGTPRRPESVLKVYVFALFNEYQKSLPTSERNFGLYKADGTMSYDIGLYGGQEDESSPSPPSSSSPSPPGSSSSAASSILHSKDILGRCCSRSSSLVLTACALVLLHLLNSI